MTDDHFIPQVHLKSFGISKPPKKEGAKLVYDVMVATIKTDKSSGQQTLSFKLTQTKGVAYISGLYKEYKDPHGQLSLEDYWSSTYEPTYPPIEKYFRKKLNNFESPQTVFAVDKQNFSIADKDMYTCILKYIYTLCARHPVFIRGQMKNSKELHNLLFQLENLTHKNINSLDSIKVLHVPFDITGFSEDYPLMAVANNRESNNQIEIVFIPIIPGIVVVASLNDSITDIPIEILMEGYKKTLRGDYYINNPTSGMVHQDKRNYIFHPNANKKKIEKLLFSTSYRKENNYRILDNTFR